MKTEDRREGRIFARGKRGTLWIAWYDAKGEHRESTGSTDQRVADRLLRERLAAKDAGKVYMPGSKRVTLGDLLEMLEDHHVETAGTKSWPRLEQCSRHLRRYFGADARAAEISYSGLEKYVKARRGDKKRPAKPATIRLELSVLAQAFKIARRREMLTSAPLFPSITVKNTRTVHFTDDELARLLDHLPAPIRAVTRFASLTGWRLQECLSLTWRAVDFSSGAVRLEPGETKSGKGRIFPFAALPELADLLENQRRLRWQLERETGAEVAHVFQRRGRPIKDIDDAWKTACRKAELKDRRFHDLRRFAAMRLVRAGVARSEAMGLMGHETESMFVRYALNDLPGLERAVKKLAALTPATDQG